MLPEVAVQSLWLLKKALLSREEPDISLSILNGKGTFELSNRLSDELYRVTLACYLRLQTCLYATGAMVVGAVKPAPVSSWGSHALIIIMKGLEPEWSNPIISLQYQV